MQEEYRFKDQLKKMGDVSITDPQHGDMLVFDKSDGVWKNMRSIGHPTLNVGQSASFTDFQNKVNAFLKSISPQYAPLLSSLSTSLSGKSGRLSFGNTKLIDMVSSVSGIGELASVDVDGLFSVSQFRKGIVSSGSDITGVLNSQVEKSSHFPATSFGNANVGTLLLEVNGQVVRTTDLTFNGPVHDSGSGFILSSPQSITFPNGDPFEAAKYRTGTFQIQRADIREGWNFFRVRHHIGDNTYCDTPYFDFVLDTTNQPVSFVNETISGMQMSGTKTLSGIRFYTAGHAKYGVSISGLYRKSYFDDAIKIDTNGVFQTSDVVIPPSNGDLSKVILVEKNLTLENGRIVGRASISTTVSKLWQVSKSQSAFVQNVLFDNVPDSETDQIEDFSSESRRVQSNTNFDDINLVPNWDSAHLISNGPPGYSNGLQVISGTLIYPKMNFAIMGNGPAGNPDYSNLKSERTFYRRFRPISGASHNMVMNFNGNGITFIPMNQPFSASSHMKVEFKAPTQTGWLDACSDYVVGKYGDYDGGRKVKDGVGIALNTPWGITLGAKSTGLSGGMICLRITVPQGFSGNLTRIEVKF